MKIIKFMALLSIFYVALPGAAYSVVLSNVCVDDIDYSTGEVLGYTCNTSTRYQLEGSANLINPLDGSSAGIISLTGVLTQDSTFTEDFYGASSGEEVWTSLTIDAEALGMSYSLDQYEFAIDWGSLITGSMADSMTGGQFLTDGLTQWLFQADGTSAFVQTLDGDADGLSGMNLFSNGDHVFVADVQLQAVPVPAALWLMGSGLFVLAGLMRRKSV